MPDSLEPMLSAWHDFYLLAGTTAGALVGLQFVAASLAATLLPITEESAVETFVTPTVVHFTAVLVVAALVLMPLADPAILVSGLGLLSLAGAVWLLPRGGICGVASANRRSRAAGSSGILSCPWPVTC